MRALRLRRHAFLHRKLLGTFKPDEPQKQDTTSRKRVHEGVMQLIAVLNLCRLSARASSAAASRGFDVQDLNRAVICQAVASCSMRRAV
jgi:hypothetical protein